MEPKYYIFLTSGQIAFQNVLINCVYMCFIHKYVCAPHACTTHKSQQLELELLIVVVTMWVLEIKSLPSGAACALSHWTTSPTPRPGTLNQQIKWWHSDILPFFGNSLIVSGMSCFCCLPALALTLSPIFILMKHNWICYFAVIIFICFNFN